MLWNFIKKLFSFKSTTTINIDNNIVSTLTRIAEDIGEIKQKSKDTNRRIWRIEQKLKEKSYNCKERNLTSIIGKLN